MNVCRRRLSGLGGRLLVPGAAGSPRKIRFFSSAVAAGDAEDLNRLPSLSGKTTLYRTLAASEGGLTWREPAKDTAVRAPVPPFSYEDAVAKVSAVPLIAWLTTSSQPLLVS